MVHIYYNLDCSHLEAYPEIIEEMRNCLETILGSKCPILKIDMFIPTSDAYPEKEKIATKKTIEYFLRQQHDQKNGYVERSMENDGKHTVVKWQFNSQHARCHRDPHIQVGGINGNMSISIRSLTDLSKECMKEIDNRMSDIVRPYVEKKE